MERKTQNIPSIYRCSRKLLQYSYIALSRHSLEAKLASAWVKKAARGRVGFWLGLAWLDLIGLCLALPCLALPCLALPCPPLAVAWVWPGRMVVLLCTALPWFGRRLALRSRGSCFWFGLVVLYHGCAVPRFAVVWPLSCLAFACCRETTENIMALIPSNLSPKIAVAVSCTKV